MIGRNVSDWMEHGLGVSKVFLKRDLIILSVLRKSGEIGYSWKGKQKVQRP